jgi:hypothetical protein
MDHENEIIWKNITPLFEISKEDILENSLDKNLKNSIYKYLEKDKTSKPSDILQLLISLKSKIQNKLSFLNIQNSDIKKISLSQNWILKIITDNTSHSFDLNIKLKYLEKNPNISIYIWDKEKTRQKKLDWIKLVTKNIVKSKNILDAMDFIFNENEKEYFDELDKNDRLTTTNFWDELSGKNLLELQEEYKRYFHEIDKLPQEDLSTKLIIEIASQKTIYLKMVMWIGDKYEGWASLLKETDNEFERLTTDIVEFSENNDDLLQKLKQLHKEIDKNDWQSTTVEKSYLLTMQSLHSQIYNKLAKNNETDDTDLINFAKIITGRDSDIDDNLRSPELAEKVLILLMSREGWAIDNFINSWESNIDDIEIKNKNPKSIIDDTRKQFYERYWNDGKLVKLFNNNLKTAGFEDILDIPEDTKYSDLTFYQKNKLSVLYRVSKKMVDWKTFWERSKERTWYLLQLEWKKAINIENNYILQDFSWLFNLVAKDYIEQVSDNLDDNFTSYWWIFAKSAKDLWIKEWSNQEKAFNIFQDIRWAWLATFSDETVAISKTTWKFALIIWVAMLAPYVVIASATHIAWWAAAASSIAAVSAGTASSLSASVTIASMWLVTQWAIAWGTATVAWWLINPHWYDTVEEAAVDLSTDLALWVVTWAIWWKIAAKASWYEWTKKWIK